MPSISTLAKLGLFVFALPLAAGCANNGEAQPAASPSQTSILVVGKGEAHAKPDIAHINLGVEERSATVSEAMQRNTTQMNQLVAALKNVGIAEKDIQTSNFNVRFERELNTPPPPYPMESAVPAAPAKPLPAPTPAPGSSKGPKVTAPGRGAPGTAAAAAPAAKTPAGFYVVSNSVEITVRDVARVGAVIDAAAAAGSNNIWGVNFELEKKDAVEGELRQKAVADARTRAEALAKLSGVQLGPIVSVSEVVSGRDVPAPMPYAGAAKMEAASSTPVEAGQMTFHGDIQVIFAIKK
ncbi:SIMPL domain-containing protein [Pendulispora albinea]|uniref:SIMPL domain-containing protein n=1 Tax=Pendulispora albinea TaxID=2741071 RepID=A0ABZ2MAW5_9BACT